MNTYAMTGFDFDLILTNRYFRNFNLYHYVFTPNMVLSLTERKVVPTLMPISIPPLASSQYVSFSLIFNLFHILFY